MRDEVLAAVSRITRIRAPDIQPHLSLATLGVKSSIGLSALRSIIEKGSGNKLPPINANMNVTELIALASAGPSGLSAAPPSPATRRAAPAPLTTRPNSSAGGLPGSVAIGLDMQDVAAMPQTDDLRDDPFYAGHFLPEEIAAAILRPDPRVHLCGVFCAKEAAKKTHPALLNLRMLDFQVTHDPAGKPMLRLVDEAVVGTRFLTLQVSITHSGSYAAATCLAMWEDE